MLNTTGQDIEDDIRSREETDILTRTLSQIRYTFYHWLEELVLMWHLSCDYGWCVTSKLRSPECKVQQCFVNLNYLGYAVLALLECHSSQITKTVLSALFLISNPTAISLYRMAIRNLRTMILYRVITYVSSSIINPSVL